MKTRKIITGMTAFIAVMVFIFSAVLIIMFVVPNSRQSYPDEDKYDFKVSHEIYETGTFTTTQIFLFPALSPYLALDKKWGKVGYSLIVLIGLIMLVASFLCALFLYFRSATNWKAFLGFIFLTGYFATALVYLVTNGIINNGYPW